MSAIESHETAAGPPDQAEWNWFGGRLRRMRLARGLTLRSFARQVGVSEAYLSLVERGRMGPPSVDIATRMARVLDTELDEFLAAAGRVSPDVVAIILQRPSEMSRLVRRAEGWSEELWASLDLDSVSRD